MDAKRLGVGTYGSLNLHEPASRSEDKGAFSVVVMNFVRSFSTSNKKFKTLFCDFSNVYAHVSNFAYRKLCNQRSSRPLRVGPFSVAMLR